MKRTVIIFNTWSFHNPTLWTTVHRCRRLSTCATAHHMKTWKHSLDCVLHVRRGKRLDTCYNYAYMSYNLWIIALCNVRNDSKLTFISKWYHGVLYVLSIHLLPIMPMLTVNVWPLWCYVVCKHTTSNTIMLCLHLQLTLHRVSKKLCVIFWITPWNIDRF